MSYPFIQARNYHKGRLKKIRLIVIHDMESPEASNTAENVARWAAGSTAPDASWHYGVDNNSVVQSVKVSDTAWHAKGVNSDGIGIEHAGRVSQKRSDWLDAFSRAELALSAKLTAKLAKDHKIAIKHLSVAELKAGNTGFIGHLDATKAYSDGQGHTDPGVSFPWDVYITMVQAEYAALNKSPWTKKRISMVAAALAVAVGVFGGISQVNNPPAPRPPVATAHAPKVVYKAPPKKVLKPVIKVKTLGVFRLARGHWYAAPSTNPHSHSGAWAKDRAGVRLLQRAVGAQADGRIGKTTTAKIRAKQKALRVTVDGKAGPRTWSLLRLP